MARRLTRREAMRQAGLLAAAAAASRVFGAPAAPADASPSSRLNVALIGCGGRGRSYLPGLMRQAAAGEVHMVALADCDEGSLARTLHAVSKAAEQAKATGFDPAKIKIFTDYRPMYDKAANEIDAVLQRCCGGLLPPTRRVVIRQGDHIEAGLSRLPHHLRGRAGAIGGGRVGVEIDTHPPSLSAATDRTSHRATEATFVAAAR